MAFVLQCIQLQCAGQIVLIDSVLSNLLSSMTDPSPRVRRLSLKGLANISYLEPQKVSHFNYFVSVGSTYQLCIVKNEVFADLTLFSI